MIKQSVKIRHQFEGFHRWEDAPEEVSFLRHRHRHIFKVSVEIDVTHDDRELEFFIEQRFLKNLFNETQECDGKSCEMLCKYILDEFNKRYEFKRSITIEVSEDGENSGIVRYSPK